MKDQLRGGLGTEIGERSAEARPRLANVRDIFGRPVEDLSPRNGGETPMELRENRKTKAEAHRVYHSIEIPSKA